MTTATYSRLLTAAILACFAVPCRLESAEPKRGSLVFEHVTVIDVERGRTIPNRTVVIDDGRITLVAAGTVSDRPADARVINADGQYLIPGLWDMHAHVTDDELLSWFLAHGVTGVRHMFSPNPLHDFGTMRRAVLDGKLPGPRFTACTHLIDGPEPALPRFARRNVYAVGSPEQAGLAVRDMKRSGDDFIKVYSFVPPDVYFAIAAEAWKQSIPFAGHVPCGVDVRSASDAGQKSIEHLSGVALACSSDEARLRRDYEGLAKAGDLSNLWRIEVKAHDSFDARKADELFRRFARNGTWHTPTLVQTRAATDLLRHARAPQPLVKTLPPLVQLTWSAETTTDGGVQLPYFGVKFSPADLDCRSLLLRGDKKLVGAMHRAGVGLLAGTDTPNPLCFPGIALHDELELLVLAGLTPAEALRTATLNPARYLGLERQLGTVAEGMAADLVLLDANPLDDIRNTRRIDAVVAAGRLICKSDLAKLTLVAANRR